MPPSDRYLTQKEIQYFLLLKWTRSVLSFSCVCEKMKKTTINYWILTNDCFRWYSLPLSEFSLPNSTAVFDQFYDGHGGWTMTVVP